MARLGLPARLTRPLVNSRAAAYCGRMDALSSRNVALGITGVGVFILLAGLLADVIGYGNEGFGSTQVILTIVGAVIAALGVYRITKT